MMAVSMIMIAACHNYNFLTISTSKSGPGHDERYNRKLMTIEYTDPKSVEVKTNPYVTPPNNDAIVAPSDRLRTTVSINGVVNEASRKNCQFIIVLGTEGSLQNDIEPIFSSLASLQPNSLYIHPRSADSPELDLFRRTFYNLVEHYGPPRLEELAPHPEMVRKRMEALCPPTINNGDGQEDGERRRIYYGDIPFPYGSINSPGRMDAWQDMTVEEIAQDVLDSGRPTNLQTMLQVFGPYADIKFIALHRPYLDTIAHFAHKDGGAVLHSKMIAGHMMAFSQFLNAHPIDRYTNSKLWMVLCLHQLWSTSYQSVEDIIAGRQRIVERIANFLGWRIIGSTTEEDDDGEDFFGHWHEKHKDPLTKLGFENMDEIRKHVQLLEGVWPPGEEGRVAEVCSVEPTMPSLLASLFPEQPIAPGAAASASSTVRTALGGASSEESLSGAVGLLRGGTSTTGTQIVVVRNGGSSMLVPPHPNKEPRQYSTSDCHGQDPNNESYDCRCVTTNEITAISETLRELYLHHGIRVFPTGEFLLGISRYGGFLPERTSAETPAESTIVYVELGVVYQDLVDLMDFEMRGMLKPIQVGDFNIQLLPYDDGSLISWKGKDPAIHSRYPFFKIRIERHGYELQAFAAYPYRGTGGYMFPYMPPQQLENAVRFNGEGGDYRIIDTDDRLDATNFNNIEDTISGVQVAQYFNTNFHCMMETQFYFTTVFVPCDYDVILQAQFGKNWNDIGIQNEEEGGDRPLPICMELA